MERAYHKAVQRVLSEHGFPVREDHHGFTSTYYFLGADGTEDLMVSLEPEMEGNHVRVVAIAFWERGNVEILSHQSEEFISC